MGARWDRAPIQSKKRGKSKASSIEKLPSIECALLQHILRAALHVKIWIDTRNPTMDTMNQLNYGWYLVDGEYTFALTRLAAALLATTVGLPANTNLGVKIQTRQTSKLTEEDSENDNKYDIDVDDGDYNVFVFLPRKNNIKISTTGIRKRDNTHMHRHTHARTRTCTHARTYVRTHARTHACTHARTFKI